MKSSPGFIDLPNKTTFRTDEVALLLSLSRRTIYRMIESGRLPAVKLGGSVRVPRLALLSAFGAPL